MGTVGRPNVRAALLAAAATSAVSTVINLATEWKTNVLAWLGVAALTLASAAIGARQDSGRGNSPGAVHTTTQSRLLSSSSSVTSSGLVMRVIQVQPDGSRTETEYFDEELAFRVARSPQPQPQPTKEGRGDDARR